MNKNNSMGFTRIDMILSLYILIIFLPILISSFKLVSRVDLNDKEVQEEIAIVQLRRKVLLARDLEVSESILSFTFNEKIWRLYESNNNLILTPGTQIILVDISSLNFSLENSCYYLNYSSLNKRKKRVISCE